MRIHRRNFLIAFGATGGALTLAACSGSKTASAPSSSLPRLGGSASADAGSSDPPPDPSVTGTVECINWWGGPEVGAINALMAGFSARYPNISVTNSAENGVDAYTTVTQQRSAAGNPADVLQMQGGKLLVYFAIAPDGKSTDSGVAEKINDLYTLDNLSAVIPQDIIDLVSFNGDPYAVPLSLARGNSLYFNKKVFADAGLTPPTTWDQFFTVCDALKAKNVVPIVLSSAAGEWDCALVFFNILLGVMGPANWRRFLQGKGSPADPAIATATATYARLMQYSNMSGDLLLKITGDATKASALNSSVLTWSDDADMVQKGTAGMCIQGDWFYGYLARTYGAAAVSSIGVAAAPGTAGKFMANVDTFYLLKGGKNPPNGRLLLRYMASRSGQDVFNPVKGAISVRTDTDLTKYDPVLQSIAKDYAAAAAVPGNVVGIHTMILPWTLGGDLNTTLQTAAQNAVTGTSNDALTKTITAFFTDRYTQIQNN